MFMYYISLLLLFYWLDASSWSTASDVILYDAVTGSKCSRQISNIHSAELCFLTCTMECGTCGMFRYSTLISRYVMIMHS